MKLEDFGFTYSHTGYMIQYKGKPIGGASSANPNKRKHWRHQVADREMHRKTAQLTINCLLNGDGYKFMKDAIAAIDAAEKAHAQG